MQDNKLFSSEFAFIIAGETSTGKTTTINTFIKKSLNIEKNLYISSKVDSTKVATIIHFVSNITKPYSIYENKKKEFNNIDEIIEWYNDSSKKSENVLLEEHMDIFFPIEKNGLLNKIVIIDMPGLNLTNKNKYNKTLDIIEKIYPNSCVINVVKDMAVNTIKQGCANIVTHADLINYEIDGALKERHKMFLKRLKTNEIFLLSNTSDVKFIELDNDKFNVYNPNSILKMFSVCYETYFGKIFEEKNITNLEDDDRLLDDKFNKNDICEFAWEYNNSDLYKYYLDELANYKSHDEISNLMEEIKKSISDIKGGGLGPVRILEIFSQTIKKTYESEFAPIIQMVESFFSDENKKESKKRDWQCVFDKIEKYEYEFNKKLLVNTRTNANKNFSFKNQSMGMNNFFN
jgi:hypothetical protein